MPYASKEQKHAWTKQAIKNGYGKWLYQKRKRINQDAAEFKNALLRITKSKDAEAAAKIARKALRDSEKRWETLGEPHTRLEGAKTVFDIPEPSDDSLFEAVTKLGLS